jgi:hypothetical protein
MNKKKEISIVEETVVSSEAIQIETKKPVKGFPDIKEFLVNPQTDQDITIEKKLTRVLAKKPNKQQFFRIHPTMEQMVDVIEDLNDKKELYLLHPSVTSYVMAQRKRIILYLGMHRNGTPFLCPVPQPDSTGKSYTWHETLTDAMLVAREKWIRLEANQTSSSYEIIEAKGNIPDPKWDEKLTMIDYVTLAFKERMIVDLEHPLIQALEGL